MSGNRSWRNTTISKKTREQTKMVPDHDSTENEGCTAELIDQAETLRVNTETSDETLIANSQKVTANCRNRGQA